MFAKKNSCRKQLIISLAGQFSFVLMIIIAFTACNTEQTAELLPDDTSNSAVMPGQNSNIYDNPLEEVMPEQNPDIYDNPLNDMDSSQDSIIGLISQEPFFDFVLFADMPTKPPAYEPILQVIPLTSEYVIYSYVVSGPVAFIDRNLDEVALPEGKRGDLFFVLQESYNEDESPVYGYVIRIGDSPTYLNVGGAVFPDFYPEPIWGADMSHYSLRNGYLITAVSVAPEYRQLCGVMDLRTVQEILAPRYDAVSLDDATIWAILDGEEFLFDYAGNLLMQSREHAGSYKTKGIQDLEELWYYEKQYRTLYLPTLTHHDGMVIAYTPDQGLSFFTEAGQHLLSISTKNLWNDYGNYYYGSYYKDADKNIIRLSDGDLVIVYADGQCKQINLPADMKKNNFYGFAYENNTLTISSWPTDYTYDDATGMLVEIAHEKSEPPGFDTKYYDGYDTLGKSFILAYNGEWNDKHQLDVLNAQGDMLLHDVLGVIYPEPSFPGTMVVWLDETNCVLLDKNGSTKSIPSYTQVESRYVDWHW